MSHTCKLCKNLKEESEIYTLICNDTFCWTCIEAYLKTNLKSKNKCPSKSCTKIMKDKEVRKVLSDEDIIRYNNICLSSIQGSYKCILPDCGSVCIIDSDYIQFNCNYCTLFNCVFCKKPHKGMPCGAAISETGRSLEDVCQTEMNRANAILQNKLAQLKRSDIIERDKSVLVTNSGIFNCEICCTDIAKTNGIVLRGCFHQICRKCLCDHVKNSSLIPVPCPFSPCKGILEDRECRQILSVSDNAAYETRSLKYASKYFEKADRCRQVNCSYMCDLDRTVKTWHCPLCKSDNCVFCNVIHTGQTCDQYNKSKVSTKDEIEIEKQIKRKELMRCPDCKTIIKKTSGCNWIPCVNCGVELCWINQTYRWGPKGPGDISGGCKCGVDDKKCHPSCGGCIADLGRRHSRYSNRPIEDFMLGLFLPRQPLPRTSLPVRRFSFHEHDADTLDGIRPRHRRMAQRIVPPQQGAQSNNVNEHNANIPRVTGHRTRRTHGRNMDNN